MADAEKSSRAAAPTAAAAAAPTNDKEHFYPPPTSSYYFGPPDASRAFGEAVTGRIGVHLPKEVVRIERDYSAGELPQYHSSFPLELEGRISPTAFSEIINDLNTLLIRAHDPARIWLDNAVAIASLYLSTLVYRGHYRKAMRELHSWIERVNRETLHPAGLSLVDPSACGFLFVELEYY